MEKIEQTYQLSPLQQGMLFHSLYAEHSGVYVQQLVCGLHHDLNIPAFERAWQHVVQRHPILRTSFRWESLQEPVQQVHQHSNLFLELQDWRERSAEDQEQQLESYLKADRHRGFDLDKLPLMRLLLCRVAESDYRLVWSSHHILLDGRSRLLLLKEVFAFYEAALQDQDFHLPLPRPYGDHIEWLQQQDLTSAEAYWREVFKEFTAPPPLDLPRIISPERSQERYGERRASLSASVTSDLQSLAQQHDLTLNTLLQGAWAILLSRYSGAQDVVFGVTRACRRTSLEGVESMVGLFINTLPLRLQVDSRKQLLDWLREIRARYVALREHEQTPLVKIQEWVGAQHGEQLFESIFVFENYELNSFLQSQGGNWKQRDFYLLERTNYPLTVAAYSGPELLLKIGYDRDRFDDETIEGLSEHLQLLLTAIASQPDVSISELPLMSAAQREQVLDFAEPPALSVAAPAGSIAEVFEAQAARSPEAIALVCGEQQLTYRELNESANQLAHYLRSLGVGPEVVVSVMLERGVEMIVGLLAILKAGGAYLPLDPQYPAERLCFMLEDGGARVLITQRQLRERVPELELPVVCLDSQMEEIACQPRQPLPRIEGMGHAQLACVLYTSGSTGRPKGVEVVQGAIVRLVCQVGYVNLSAGEVILQLAPISFDASTFEIWGALLNGGRLVVMPPGAATLAEIGRVLREQGITTLWLTAGLFHQMVEWELESLVGVRQLLAGGDVLSAVHVRQLVEASDNGQLLNGYGPTESTTFASTYRIEQSSTWGNAGVPIGRAIDGRRIHILDEEQRAVPVGMAGEICIGGEGLARCYRNRAELTAERFVPDPYSATGGDRLYRTGDRGRYRRDGMIEYLGRIDQQVKIRGHRIELGEIETLLNQHPQVEQAIVITHNDGPDKHLIAYLVAHENETLSPSEVRKYLSSQLPEYMVPAAFVRVEAIPLTPNGKVDRRALASFNKEPQESRIGYEEPRTPIEELVVGIWAEVLKVSRVGIHDNFFEWGGHSLLATQVMSRVREAFSVELGLRRLFEAPTVAGLADAIEAALHRGEQVQAAAIEHVEREAVPLSFAQQRIWLLEQLEGGSALYNIPQFHRLSGPLEVGKLEAALNEIVARHEVLRTSFVVIDGEPWQVIATSARLQLAVVEVGAGSAAEREAEVQRLARAEAQRPFDLERGPLLRASLWRLAEEEHGLLLSMHHIISDGWSLEIMRKELAALYEAGVKGESAGLAELEIQYGDYAVWQREWLQGAVLEEQLEYWRGQLAGVPAVLELPSDRVRPAVASHCGGSYHFELSPEVSEGLRQLSRACGATLFMVLLAGFKMLLWRLSGQGDVVVGTPIAGRTRQEVEGLIGFFVNTLVLRTEVVGQLSFRELVERVRKVCVEAYAHQDVPFEKLVEELGVERELSRSPLFQVMFSLQNQDARELQLVGVSSRIEVVDRGTAKFDLLMAMKEQGETLGGSIEYSTDLFDRETIERMAGLFEQVLRAVVADREQLLWQVPLLSAGERRKQVEEWNATARDYAELSGLHEFFERQAAVNPNAVAVLHEAGEVSYGELNARANELASYLRSEYGVGPEVLVGLMVERGLEMVVGILGILKAGGAYLPLDPQYPVGRLRYMLEDGGAQLLLTQQALLTKVGELKMPVVCLDSQWPERVVASEPQRGSAGASNLAYVIYTSGSTGQPKGVGITHASALVMVQWAREVYPAAALSGVLASTSICFDLSVFELFVPLSWGGSVILAETALALPRLRFADAVTLVNTVPSVMAELLRTEGLPAAVRIVNLAGEALHRQLVEAVYQQPQVEQVWNLYGPTEDTTYSTYALVPRGETTEPVIGRPLANTQVYILDEGLGVVPVGVAGEIYLGGAGLARGYLGRPALTAERFVPDPYSASAGARLYRTGDRGRYQADGQIQYLGRADQQIKLRGFRIELGEIEAALTDHPAVRECVVVIKEDEAKDKHLLAYVTGEGEIPPDVTELRNYLKQMVPHYMLPSAIMVLPALPLTSNGKVDRLALLAQNLERVQPEDTFVAPRTEEEKLLASIWSDILGIERIGIYDNFFELGGHSLLAMQVIARVRAALQVELPLRKFFEDATVAGLALVLSQRDLQQKPGSAGKITRASQRVKKGLQAKVDKLSDAEVDSLLHGLLPGD